MQRNHVGGRSAPWIEVDNDKKGRGMPLHRHTTTMMSADQTFD